MKDLIIIWAIAIIVVVHTAEAGWVAAMSDTNETALTLQEVADRLGLAYSTIFAKRQQIGFRLPGSRVWRVWPSLFLKTPPKVSYNRNDSYGRDRIGPNGVFAASQSGFEDIASVAHCVFGNTLGSGGRFDRPRGHLLNRIIRRIHSTLECVLDFITSRRHDDSPEYTHSYWQFIISYRFRIGDFC